MAEAAHQSGPALGHPLQLFAPALGLGPQFALPFEESLPQAPWRSRRTPHGPQQLLRQAPGAR